MILVFHYVCCDNNLSDLVFRDFAKLTNFQQQPKSCAFYILMDAQKYGRYLVTIDSTGLNVNRVHKELDMSDMSCLDSFIENGLKAYPRADKYAFIYGGHGDNFYIVPEEDKKVTVDDFLLPFKNRNIKLELLILDCCLLSSLECLAQVKDYSKYTIACEHWGLNSGVISNHIVSIFDNFTGVELGRMLVDETDKFIDDSDEKEEIYTVVLIDNSKIDRMLNELEKFTIDKQISYVELKSRYGIDQRNINEADVSYLDLYYFVHSTTNGKNKSLLGSIEDVVVYMKANNLGHTLVKGIQFCPSTMLYPDYKEFYEIKSIPYKRYSWLRELHETYNKEILAIRNTKSICLCCSFY